MKIIEKKTRQKMHGRTNEKADVRNFGRGNTDVRVDKQSSPYRRNKSLTGTQDSPKNKSSSQKAHTGMRKLSHLKTASSAFTEDIGDLRREKGYPTFENRGRRRVDSSCSEKLGGGGGGHARKTEDARQEQ